MGIRLLKKSGKNGGKFEKSVKSGEKISRKMVKITGNFRKKAGFLKRPLK